MARTKKPTYGPIDAGAEQALREFKARMREEHGPRVSWKTRLLQAWMRSSEPGVLQALRNTHGPTWLESYELPEDRKSN